MSIPKPRLFQPTREPVPKFFTQLPDDIDEDGELSVRPGPAGILRALLRLIRRSGSQDRSIICTHKDIATEARVTDRTVRTHLGRLDRLGYISREELSPAGGQTARQTRFVVTYQLRPGLKLEAGALTISGSQSASTRKKSSASTRKKSSASSTLFERACEQRYSTEEINRGNSPRTPPGEETAPLLIEISKVEPIPEVRPEPEYLEYPEDGGMWMIMPGEHALAEIEARELWGDLWRAWKSPRLCIGFYEHQQWYSFRAWKHAIKTVLKRGTRPNSIHYLEMIAVDADTNGIPADKPIQRGSIGPVPYVPTAQQPKRSFHVAKQDEPEKNVDPVGFELFSRFLRARGDEARTAAAAELDRYVAEHSAAAKKKTGCGASLESPPQPAGVHIPRPDLPHHDHTVKACSGQEAIGTEENGQRARQDSNLQPSDSKSGISVPDLTPSSVPFYDQSPPIKPPD
ncbi:MAG TPA: hypothetical protein VKF17_16700 [Isosphaeraceae bacterium]|nr:hypothetical protein [Isosphaeraceae bacterium]